MGSIMTDPRVVLRERFGHDDFRGRQREAVEAVLAGRDVLLTMPTGAGKSLAYQLPAVMLDGLTLVVSPLIALMKDQVDDLVERGVEATFVNSSLDGPKRARRLEAAARGEHRLLFVTPERFRSPDFGAALPRLRVVRLAVDEAHCISEWGHDFRPDYSRVGEYRRRLGDPPTIALTATATPRVAEDIVGQLRLRDPLVIRTGIERPELFLACSDVDSKEEKVRVVAERIAAIDGPGIVYSALIRDLEEMHGELRRRGVRSLVYHGKLSAEERRRMQDRFMESEREVVLATNAFGMGIDKADIRFVLHAQMPGTLEAWVQEVGRAGRDGRPSFCELLFHADDIAVQQGFVEWSNPSRDFLVSVFETLRGWGERLQAHDQDDLVGTLLLKNRSDQRVSLCLRWLDVLGVTEGSFETHDLRLVRDLDPAEIPPAVGTEEKRRSDLMALLGITRFAGSREECRRATVARHFALAEPEGPCGACDVCTDRDAWIAGRLAPRPSQEEEPAPGGEAGEGLDERPAFQRGDWVRIGGRELAQVLRVEGTGRRQRLLVESARDLERRTVDVRRVRVERVRDGGASGTR